MGTMHCFRSMKMQSNPRKDYRTPIKTAKDTNDSEIQEKEDQTGEDKLSSSEQENIDADIPGSMVDTSQSDAIGELLRQPENIERDTVQEITEFKSAPEAKRQKEDKSIMTQVRRENESIRAELDSMKKSAQHSFYSASEETKQKELKIENEDLKLHLRKIKDTDRPSNSSIPSDRVVMNWPKELFEVMTRKIDRQLKLIQYKYCPFH